MYSLSLLCVEIVEIFTENSFEAKDFLRPNTRGTLEVLSLAQFPKYLSMPSTLQP